MFRLDSQTQKGRDKVFLLSDLTVCHKLTTFYLTTYKQFTLTKYRLRFYMFQYNFWLGIKRKLSIENVKSKRVK